MSLMLMRVRTSIYQKCRRLPCACRMPQPRLPLYVCRRPPPIWSTDAGWLYVKETERTTCTKVGMTFSELDVSLKVSHDECFRVKFEQDYKLMNFLSIYPEVGRKLSKLSCETFASVWQVFSVKISNENCNFVSIFIIQTQLTLSKTCQM